MRQSIKRTLYIPIIAIFLLTSIIGHLLLREALKENLEERMQAHAHSMTIMMAAVSESTYQKEHLKRILTRVAAQRSIKSFLLVQTDTDTIYLANKREVEAQSFSAYIKSKSNLVQANIKRFDYKAPFVVDGIMYYKEQGDILIDNNLVPHTLYLEMDFSKALKVIDTLLLKVGLTFVVFILITVLLVHYVINSHVIQPAIKIENAFAAEDSKRFRQGGNELDRLYKVLKRSYEAQKEQQKEIEAAHAFLKQLINVAPVRIFWKDKEGRYLGVNRLTLEDAGLSSEEEMLGKSDYELSWHEQADMYRADDQKVMQSKQAKINYIETQTRPDGSQKYLSTSKVPLINNQGEVFGILGMYQDITKQHEDQDQLHQQEKLLILQSRHAAMGEMIGMIAHQWRQPLSVISIAATKLELMVEVGNIDPELIKENCKNVNQQCLHLSQTINDFRDFFKPNRERDHVEVAEVVENAIHMISNSLEMHNITVKRNYQTGIYADIFSRELLQVVVNLIKNAQDAYVDASIAADKRLITITSAQEDDSFVLRIADQAGGIPQKILEKVFDPYFTTKDAKNGTGIGLYMVKTIIEKHFSGSVEVENRDGGATFIIRFPIVVSHEALAEPEEFLATFPFKS